MMHQIDILLSTHNGEKFLSAQMESLFCQTYTNWRLVIRDDLSTDNTVILINDYKSKWPDKIEVLDNQAVRKGVVGSFECLIEASTARYVAFCDQDDVWRPDKLQLQVENMRKLEEDHGISAPILVHTDLSVVNDNLRLISESFWDYQHLNPDKMCTLSRMLVQNCVTGCTVLINRPLVELTLPFPGGVIMHDWWIALIAVSEGIVSDIKTTTVKYRQHENNDTGARHWDIELIIKMIKQGREPLLQSLLRTHMQAEALVSSGVLSDVNRRIVEKYISLYSSNWLTRRFEMLRMHFFKYGLIRNIAMFLRI